MSKYITEFQLTGISTINVDKVCKDWEDGFFIYKSLDDDTEKYTFEVNSKRKSIRYCSAQISKEQALEVIGELSLIFVRGAFFNLEGTYHTESFIDSEIERIRNLKRAKERELDAITKMLYRYQVSL